MIRPFRKPFTIAGAALGAMVLSFCLATAPVVSAAQAKTVEDYAEGAGGELQCYPPPDTTACGETTANPQFELIKREIIAKCSSHFKDDKELQKFKIAATGIFIPGLTLVSLTYIASEFAEDAAKCVLKGFLSYGGHPEWESSVDDTFALINSAGLGSSLKSSNLGDRINQVRAELALSAKDRALDFSEKVENAGTYEEIKTFKDLYNSWLGGRFGVQKVALDAVKRKSQRLRVRRGGSGDPENRRISQEPLPQDGEPAPLPSEEHPLPPGDHRQAERC